jgi:antitoxin (DNA-binding transcriptional repressor) of toxin-antitoxin stability system
MQLEIHQAKGRLSAMIAAARGGSDVIIVRDGVPLVRLAPVVRRPFRIGILAGKVPPGGPDFLEPMHDAEQTDWETGAP